MEINVGDKVQIKNGGIDVTNGNKAVSGKKYGEGGPLWATVELIDPNWYTGGQYGMPLSITKVRCKNDQGVIVWQVQLKDISENVIRASQPELVQTEPLIESKQIISEVGNTKSSHTLQRKEATAKSLTTSEFVVPYDTNEWNSGERPEEVTTGYIDIENRLTSSIMDTSMGINDSITKNIVSGTWRNLNETEKRSIGSNSIKIDEGVINRSDFKTAFENPNKRKEMLNENKSIIQNGEAYPKYSKPSFGLMTAKYDYRIIPGDTKFPRMVSLEDKLEKVRASFGIHVHGNNNIARAVKYYSYNRFKVPDINLAYTKTFTHIFFTRPDLNLLKYSISGNNEPISQIINNSETAMLWRRNPELFKLLTNCERCGDKNNFNFLLSNQINSFNITDDTISVTEVGKSWNGHTMAYADQFTGRTGGELSIGFDEVSDLSVINLLTLWLTYIENVSNGAWSPSYNLKGYTNISTNSEEDSYVYTRSIDYASSIYVFTCDEKGEDVLHWTKYYGVFPLTNGKSVLSWQKGEISNGSPKLNINFRYCYKRSNDPNTLIEFNDAAMVSDPTSEASFNPNYGHSSRPFVGAPFIEIKLKDPKLKANDVNSERESSHIRLKFKKAIENGLDNDKKLYRFNLH